MKIQPPKKPQRKINMTVRIDPVDLDKLDQILKEENITRSHFIQSVIAQYINQNSKEE
ncbi:hypothetical protein [Savagea faecisuis]|uniref:Ribbon-helix-helix protein CopG domain-containing protein n=1 Tax=Savagea faecisuis TaxID=1274803 RepID=A0ABW3H1S9_9BACL